MMLLHYVLKVNAVKSPEIFELPFRKTIESGKVNLAGHIQKRRKLVSCQWIDSKPSVTKSSRTSGLSRLGYGLGPTSGCVGVRAETDGRGVWVYVSIRGQRQLHDILLT